MGNCPTHQAARFHRDRKEKKSMELDYTRLYGPISDGLTDKPPYPLFTSAFTSWLTGAFADRLLPDFLACPFRIYRGDENFGPVLRYNRLQIGPISQVPGVDKW